MRTRLARLVVAAALAGGLGGTALYAPATADPLPDLGFAPGSDVDEVMRMKNEMDAAARAEWNQRMWEAEQAEKANDEYWRGMTMAACGCDPVWVPENAIPFPYI